MMELKYIDLDKAACVNHISKGGILPLPFYTNTKLTGECEVLQLSVGFILPKCHTLFFIKLFQELCKECK